MLNVSPLTLGYDGQAILQFEGLSLAKGGDCLLTGISGSGKTTLLYTIAGLIPPIDGHIEVNGTNMTRLSEGKRDKFRGKHIGIIFQTLHLVKSLSVTDNLLLASYIAGIPQKKGRVEEVLKQMGILDKKDDLPSNLSQGQQQRVAIARAIMHNPLLILADEPTSSLDDHSCEAVITLIKQVAKDTSAALVISTHDSRVKAHFSHIIPIGAAS